MYLRIGTNGFANCCYILMLGNADAKERSLLLKIDVESAEWKVLAEEPVENLLKFRKFVIAIYINVLQLSAMFR